ncbi:hypothetical protein LINPERPRIM_LOCUS8436 [Linum perenne]
MEQGRRRDTNPSS